MSGSGGRADEVTVGLDIGTTSVKAVAADANGRVLVRARVPHTIASPTPGAFQHDIDQAWRADVLAALAEVVGAVDADGVPGDGPRRRVAGVNVSAMVPSLGAVDADGRACSPGLLYGDLRGATETNRPDEAGDSGELLAFLGWLAGAAPDAAGYWPAQAVANHALTGVGAIDSTTAMTAMPLFDGIGWDAEHVATAGVDPSTLPTVVPGTASVGTVLDGLPAAGAAVGGGTIDGLAEQVVAGADTAGDVLVICGATLITWGVVDEWATVPGLWTVPHTAAGLTLVGGPSNAGGIFLDRVGRWLGPATPEEVDAVGPEDLPVWLPYVRGERCPLHRRDLRARLDGAATHHEAAHLRRAAYEASAFVARHLIERAGEAALAPTRIVATGGGTRAEAWMRALADVTGLPVDVVAVPEGAALGAAFMARCTAGLEDPGASMVDARRWARTDRRIEPDSAWTAAAEPRYQRFLAMTADALATSPAPEP